MVYIGYSVSIKEALRICNIQISLDYEENYYEYVKEATKKIKEKLLQNSYKLNFYSLDKGVYVIGYQIDEYLSNMCVDIDSLTITIIQLKIKVKKAILHCNIDLSNVEIETDLEDYPILFENPEPFYINYP